MQSRFDIAILGGGAAGTLAAIQGLRQARTADRIVLFEPGARLAEGVAYATARGEHLLNVPTGRMSALADHPDDFLDWLAARPGHHDTAREALARGYAQRRDYALYLRDRLQQARHDSVASLEVVPMRIDQLRRADDHWQLHGADGRFEARRVLLAVGNAARPLPARGASTLPRPRRLDAWDYAGVAAIDADAEVCIAGTGLSMVDAVLTLAGNGHRGRIHLLSRHGLLPLAHTPVHEVDDTLQPAELHGQGVRARLRRLRRQVRDAATRGLPWQAVMERLRPHVQALWRSLPAGEQRRFLRHASRHWDIHRHRIAPSVHAVLRDLLDSGRLRIHRARLDMVAGGPRCVQLTARTRDGRGLVLDVDHVINATGVEMRVQAMRNPLLEQLLGDGYARAGAHGIGLDCDAGGRLRDAAGVPQDDLRVIGSLRIGEAWESIAVPELRVQAAEVIHAWRVPGGVLPAQLPG